MFSSRELVSFVFANPNEIYYGADLLKLNLNQFLWKELHKTYKTVYFLTPGETLFDIRTYGDKDCNAYKSRGWMGGSESSQLKKWMQKRLRDDKNPAVFVSTMQNFCDIFSQEEKFLKEIAGTANRTGGFVLTASTMEEATKTLLLESPVFQWLNEQAVISVRCAQERKLFHHIREGKPKSCYFLDRFQEERIRNLLIHLAMAKPRRQQNLQVLENMARWLTKYLCDPSMQEEQRLFDGEEPICYMLYKEIFAQLANDSVWKRLKEYSTEYNGDALTVSPESFRVLPGYTCYAGRCLRISLPRWLRVTEDAQTAGEILSRIRQAVSSPKNRKENPQIVSHTEGFLKQLDDVSANDTETYTFLLQALEFCVEWVYNEEDDPLNEDVMKVISWWQQLTSGSMQHFAWKRSLDALGANTLHSLQAKKVHSIQKDMDNWDVLKPRICELISTITLGLKTGSSNVSSMAEEMRRDMESYIDKIQQEEPSQIQPLPTTVQEDPLPEIPDTPAVTQPLDVIPEDLSSLYQFVPSDDLLDMN